ncbi:MAG: hypothetical protein A6F72_08475 [Cycloclasticus sp. symbiont of Poecilosclerida sp. N]|nr:MAG: hypothetical protein A6F72_08475 [Cycloclasticus sp. symbiont of Poecilosclerida sp. N]
MPLKGSQHQLTSSTHSSCLFEITDTYIKPLSYQYKQPLGDDLKDIKLSFDWQQYTLNNYSEGKTGQ